MVCDCLRLVDICHLWLPHTLPIFWSYLLLYVLPSQVQRTENLCSQTALQLQHKSEAWFLPIECTHGRLGFKSRQWEEVVRCGTLSMLIISVVEASPFSELLAPNHEQH